MVCGDSRLNDIDSEGFRDSGKFGAIILIRVVIECLLQFEESVEESRCAIE